MPAPIDAGYSLFTYNALPDLCFVLLLSSPDVTVCKDIAHVTHTA